MLRSAHPLAIGLNNASGVAQWPEIGHSIKRGSTRAI
jgi:hypothetical protein